MLQRRLFDSFGVALRNEYARLSVLHNAIVLRLIRIDENSWLLKLRLLPPLLLLVAQLGHLAG